MTPDICLSFPLSPYFSSLPQPSSCLSDFSLSIFLILLRLSTENYWLTTTHQTLCGYHQV